MPKKFNNCTVISFLPSNSQNTEYFHVECLNNYEELLSLKKLKPKVIKEPDLIVRSITYAFINLSLIRCFSQ